MMKRYILIITIIAIPALAVSVFLATWKNLVVINPTGSTVYINEKIIGSGAELRLRVPFGGAYLKTEGADNELHYVNWSLARKELKIGLLPSPKTKAYETERFLSTFIGPRAEGNEVWYLGKRNPEALIALNPEAKSAQPLSADVLRGAIDVKWSPSGTKALVEIDKSLALSDRFKKAKNNIWIYNLGTGLLAETEFTKADFATDERVIGIRQGYAQSLENGEYSRVIENSFYKVQGIMVRNDSIFINTDTTAYLYVSGKKQLETRGKTQSVSLAEDGAELAFSFTDSKGKVTTVLYDKENGKRILPFELESLSLSSGSLFGQSKDTRVWEIDTKALAGVAFKKYDYKVNNIFGNNSETYITINSNLEKVLN